MMRRLAILGLVTVLLAPLAGCGSGGGSGGDDSSMETPDQNPTTTPVVISPSPTPLAPPQATVSPTPTPGPSVPTPLPSGNLPGSINTSAFVITSDFQTGSFATFPLSDPTRVTSNIAEIHSDAVARSHDGLVYVVNRLGADNIQALDPSAGFVTRWQCSVGNGANPHDIIFAAPDKAYVTLYGRTTLAIVDPSTGPTCDGFLRGTIDLASFADADGLPEMDQGIIVGGRLYVTVQRLNRGNFFRPTDRSEVVVIDVATDTVIDVDPATSAVDGIVLSAPNPFSGAHGLALDPQTGKILVGVVGAFETSGDGGIERVDPATNRAEGFFATETGLGGNITDFVVVSDTQAYAVIFARSGSNELVRFDPSTGARGATLLSSSDFLVDVALDPSGTLLLLTDRTLFDPGIRIFSVTTDTEVTSGPVGTGLPPFDLLFLGGASAPEPPAPIVCGDGVTEGDEECDDGNVVDEDACLSNCRVASCGDGVIHGGVEECDGSDDSCAADDLCAADCFCGPPDDVCTATVVTVALDTPEILGSATLVLDYPEGSSDIPGSGADPSVRNRVDVLTSASLFSGGSPNDEDDQIVFALFSTDGVETGSLLAVTFDCLGAPPSPAAFTCAIEDASTLGLAPIAGVTCSLEVVNERD